MTPRPTPAPQDQALHSVFTTNLAEILAQLQISLIVSTYQAGKVILVRHDGGAAATQHRWRPMTAITSTKIRR